MRRSDREIKDFKKIMAIIEDCEVMRIGLSDGGLYPYIVPVNFGYETVDSQLYFYIHGAMAGRKYELMRKNGACSFEMDCGYELVIHHEEGEATMHYKSVMGRAELEFLEGEDKLHGLNAIMRRDARTREMNYGKGAMPRTAVVRLRVTEITGKQNPGEK
jgi:nitroimidazol reductase NimA-like FMN-containing flavoprotein (pyridoxamine 5'-phosphate oxidase superfamily)